jgi:hypothetical protein
MDVLNEKMCLNVWNELLPIELDWHVILLTVILFGIFKLFEISDVKLET